MWHRITVLLSFPLVSSFILKPPHYILVPKAHLAVHKLPTLFKSPPTLTTNTHSALHLSSFGDTTAYIPAISHIFIRGGHLSASLRPSAPELLAAAVLPSCIGLWKSGYTVSYGYGGAILAAASLTLFNTYQSSGMAMSLASVHAASLAFYGIRLCLFLLWREVTLPVEIHKMKKRDASLGQRLKRLPLIIGCSMLFFLMASTLRVSLYASTLQTNNSMLPSWIAVGISFFGFLLAAVGDWYKSVVKAKEGPDFLVTTGPYRFLRHPNYTGEMIGWTGNLAVALFETIRAQIWRISFPWLIASGIGWAGIFFAVLAGEATAGLEKKQKEKHGGTKKYEDWVQRTWAGPMISMGGGNSSSGSSGSSGGES